MSCETIIDEIFFSERSLMYLVSHATPCTSTWLVGSSSSSSSGSLSMARESARRMRQPPESEPTGPKMSSSENVHERIMSMTCSLVLPISWMSGSEWMNSQQMKSASAAETSHST